MTPITLPGPSLYFSLERFNLLNYSFCFYFKISISFPVQFSEICIYPWIQIFLCSNFRWNEFVDSKVQLAF